VTVVDDDGLDDEAFLAAWAAEDENALEVLLDALPHVATDAVPPLSELQAAVARIRAGVASQTWPYTYFTAAADWSPAPPHDDVQCFLDAIVSTMLPDEDPDDEWTDDELGAVAALEHADWVGSVIGLARAGVAADASPEALIRYIDECPRTRRRAKPGRRHRARARLRGASAALASDRRRRRGSAREAPRRVGLAADAAAGVATAPSGRR
jgi:hypothetical protein